MNFATNFEQKKQASFAMISQTICYLKLNVMLQTIKTCSILEFLVAAMEVKSSCCDAAYIERMCHIKLRSKTLLFSSIGE